MSSTSRRIAAGVLLLVAIVAAYSPVLRAGYIIDDDNYVTENVLLRDVSGLRSIWLDPATTPQYYPLVFTSFWLEFRVWELSPIGYHAVNVGLHALCVWLLWIALRKFSLRGSWLAAAVFALHPVHVESVAWIAERKNVLSALFYLLALLAFLRFFELDRQPPANQKRWGIYLLALLLFVAALLSKTATVTLPAAILLLIWWKRGRIALRDALHLAPAFAMSVGFGSLTLLLETTKGGATGGLWDLSWIERVLVAGRAVWFYAAKLVWPIDLSFNYERWVIDPSAPLQYAYPLATVLVVVALWAFRHRLGRGPLVAVLYFIGTLFPTLGFFNVFFFRYAYVADHFQYLASVGLIALFCSAVTRLVARQGDLVKRWGAALAGLLLVALGGLTWSRTQVFQSLEVLCLDTLEKNPSSWLANNNLGNIYLQRGEIEEAVSYFETALENAPTYVETHVNLAIAKMNLGRFEESIQHSRQAIDLHPQNKFGYKSLGDALLRAGRSHEAIPWYQEAVAKDPAYVKALVGLGTALTQAGRPGEAVASFEAALVEEPDHLVAHTHLAIALAEINRFEDAVAYLETAARLDPDNLSVRQNLALVRERAAAANVEEE